MTEHQDDEGTPAPGSLWWNIAAGAIFSVAALIAMPLVGGEISSIFNNDEGQVTWLTFFVGVFITGWFFWWLVMSLSPRFSVRRGAVTGVLIALFAYPVVLTLAEVFQRGWSASFTGIVGTFPERMLNVLMLTGLTLLTTGFAATLIMAATGAALAFVLIRVHPPTATRARLHAARPRNAFLRGLWRAIYGTVAGIVLLLVGIFAWLSLMPYAPIDPSKLQHADAPAKSYEEGIAAFEAVQVREGQMALHERCHSTLLTHGSKVARVVIFFHGLTNCPAQADELAPKLFELGYNVYIPRLPGHGEADPMTLALADVSAENLVDNTNESIDLARGLGDEVVVVGLSAGGTMSAWAAQYRTAVDNSISVAPFLGPHVVPAWANHAATNLLLMLPNMMVWWNPMEPVVAPEMDYAYPRFATHALGQVMRLGGIVQSSARREPPMAQNMSMLLNDADLAISNVLAEQLVASWRDHGQDVKVQIVPGSRRLPHDLIDPRQDGADVDFVYPMLIDMMNARQ